ncbi:sushi domain-containing protein 3 isoform X1 [Nothobranchius furzeri]|uniref:Sushi domain containing 3 n=2 Tax=Nothobranchius furzeri TaxID=105023 RepID=A0A1A7ZIU9_NOTFU|nr:transcript variant X1 [Nothobranchius furzeri]
MSGATAATADGSRTELKKTDKSRAGKKDHWQLQCSPIPLPALGTQRIIQGNGTNVGSIVSLQCPARHKLVGKDLMCVMGSNSTQWVGQTYCQPLSFYEDYGFRVAVLSSIISSGIILLLSVAFITCCLLNCIKEDSKKRFDSRKADAEQQEVSHSYKGRNNNNNNTQEKTLPSWDAAYPAQCENMRPCRGQQLYNYCPQLSHAAFPGHENEQPFLPGHLDSCPLNYSGPPMSSCQTSSSDLLKVSADKPGSAQQSVRS